MRKFSLLLFVIVETGIASAWHIDVPAQPVSPYADTEVSTNVVVHTGRTDAREVKLHLELEGTPTNDLEVAFGCDVNTNGVLDVSEIETVYGWRGGRYFIENAREWNWIETEAAGNASGNPPVAEGDQVGRMSEANEPRSGRKSPGVFDIQLKNDRSYTPALFTAICGVEGAFLDFGTNPPAWLFRKEWNMMRVVRRGAEPMAEWVRCTVDHEFFYIHLR